MPRSLMLIASLALIVAACSGDSEASPNAAPAGQPTPQVTAAATATPAPTTTSAATPDPTAAAATLAGALAPSAMAEPRPAPELAGLVNADGSSFDLTNFLIVVDFTEEARGYPVPDLRQVLVVNDVVADLEVAKVRGERARRSPPSSS